MDNYQLDIEMGTDREERWCREGEEDENFRESRELIEETLRMAFGCITYLRGLFDEDCYEEQRYYAEEGNGIRSGPNDDAESVRVKTLVRGKSMDVDTLMDWVEKGVFPLIALNHLRLISFEIYTNDPLVMRECYNFSIEYKNGVVGLNIQSVDGEIEPGSVSSGGSKDVCSSQTRKHIVNLLRRVNTITQTLPSLPDQKALFLRLLFNEGCPLQYQPSHLFRDISSEQQPMILIDKLESEQDDNTVGFCTLNHDFGFKILNSSLELLNETHDVDPFELLHDTIPSQIAPVYKSHSRIELPRKSVFTTKSVNLAALITGDTSCVSESQPLHTSKQSIEIYECECESSVPLIQIEQRSFQCQSCHKYKHLSCYGYDSKAKLIPSLCYTCRCKTENKALHQDLAILLNVRKVYTIIYNSGIPRSVSDLITLLGFPESGSVQCLIKAVNILIYDGVLDIVDKPMIRLACKKNLNPAHSDFITGSNYMIFDRNGIFSNEEELQGEIAVSFAPLIYKHGKNRGTHYKEIVMERREFYFKETLEFYCDTETQNQKLETVTSQFQKQA